MSDESFDLQFYVSIPRAELTFIKMLCDYFINRGYIYDQEAGYWLDKESIIVQGTFNEAIEAFTQGTGSMVFQSKSQSIQYKVENNDYRENYKIELRFNLPPTVFLEFPSIVISCAKRFVYSDNWIDDEDGHKTTELRSDFVQEIDIISRELWALIKPIYGNGGGDDYLSDYQPTKSDMEQLRVQMLFPMNFFSKQFVDSIGEEKILKCGAEKILKFPDGSIMIWPTKNPMNGGGPRKIAPFERALGMKHEIWILGRRRLDREKRWADGMSNWIQR